MTLSHNLAKLVVLAVTLIVGGWAVFREWPDRLSLTGLVIIMIAGVSSNCLAQRGH